MLTVIANFTFNTNHTLEMHNLFLEIVNNSKNASGCLDYKFYRNPDKTNNFVLIERWKNKSFIDAHISSEFITNAREKIKFAVLSPPQITFLKEIA